MPSIEGGGVEKNLFIISNYLGQKIPNTVLITGSKSFNSEFDNLRVINPKINVENFSFKRLKFLFCIIELIKLFLKDRNYLVFSFQANLYCALICRIFKIKIIVRSNSSPSGWDLGFFRKIIFYFFLRLPNKIVVNSKAFKNEYKKRFNLSTKYIYNPLNTNRLIKLLRKKYKKIFLKILRKQKLFLLVD